MVVNDTKIYKKMKSKSWMSVEKNIIEWGKKLYYNYKKLFSFKKSGLLSTCKYIL